MGDTSVLGRSDGVAGSEQLFHQIECHATSEIGTARPVNQDQYLLAPLTPSSPETDPAYLFAVADGLGGAPAGDRASLIATRTLFRTLREPWTDPGDTLKRAVLRCQHEIDAHGERHPERAGMATTLTAALVLWPKVYIVHVGDSRCYALRPSRAERITVDHSIAQRMAGIGVISQDQVPRSRWKNVLSNVIGRHAGAVHDDASVGRRPPAGDRRRDRSAERRRPLGADARAGLGGSRLRPADPDGRGARRQGRPDRRLRALRPLAGLEEAPRNPARPLREVFTFWPGQKR
jgi:protein phosphatase